jgi:uncharacterized protein DUF4249
LRTDVRCVLAAAALAGLLGCVDQSLVAPSANVLIVQAVLDAGAPDQYVVVQQTNGAIARQVAVDGATVSLTFPDGHVLAAVAEHDSMRVERDGNGPPIGTVYHFALGAQPLVPGGTYHLRVATPDGRVVTGTTTIPSATPAADTTTGPTPVDLFRDTLPIVWRRVPGASGYEVRVEGQGIELSLFTDTSFVLTLGSFEAASGNFQLDSVSHLVVSAVDANYYDYFRHKPDSFTGNGVINHLDGAIGLFGSIVEIDRRTLKFR